MKRSVLLAMLFAALGAAQAAGSVIVLVDGTILKAISYEVGSSGTMKLKVDDKGAAVYVPIRQVDRIVDDDVSTPEIEAAMAKVVYDRRTIIPARSWRYSAGSGPLFRSNFDNLIVAAARKFDVDAALVSALIKTESDFNPREVSKKGACGLMQLMPATADRFGVADPFDPAANINGGTKYLRWLLDTFHGNADLALAAYNAGEANVFKYNSIPPFRETVNYVNRIAAHLQRTLGRHTVGIVR